MMVFKLLSYIRYKAVFVRGANTVNLMVWGKVRRPSAIWGKYLLKIIVHFPFIYFHLGFIVAYIHMEYLLEGYVFVTRLQEYCLYSLPLLLPRYKLE